MQGRPLTFGLTIEIAILQLMRSLSWGFAVQSDGHSYLGRIAIAISQSTRTASKILPGYPILMLLLLSILGTSVSQSRNPSTQTRPPSALEVEIRFRNGDVSLAGTLMLPVSSRPVAAIVLTHGSGPATRLDSKR